MRKPLGRSFGRIDKKNKKKMSLKKIGTYGDGSHRVKSRFSGYCPQMERKPSLRYAMLTALCRIVLIYPSISYSVMQVLSTDRKAMHIFIMLYITNQHTYLSFVSAPKATHCTCIYIDRVKKNMPNSVAFVHLTADCIQIRLY